MIARRTAQTAQRPRPAIAAPEASSIFHFKPPRTFGPKAPSPAHAPNVGTRFFNLSTKRRYEKGKGNEPPPDVSKLELMRPSEWRPADSSVIGNRRPLSITSPTSFDPLFDDNELFVPLEAPEPSVHATPSQVETSFSTPGTASTTNPFDGQVAGLPPRPNNREPSSTTTAAPELPIVIRTSQGPRSLRKGDILVTLSYGPDKRHVGPVRLCGLRAETKTRLLSKKRDADGVRHRELEVWLQHLLTSEEYDKLCLNVGGCHCSPQVSETTRC